MADEPLLRALKPPAEAQRSSSSGGKKGMAHGGGHHGGAWKVAYADFVTAMMALFIVLWQLMSADKEVQQDIVSAYFNNPSGPGKLTGTAAAGTAGNKSRSPSRIWISCAKKFNRR